MKPVWDAQIDQLRSSLESWRANEQRFPTNFVTSQGVTLNTADVGLSLREMFQTLKLVNESEIVDPILLGIHQPGVLNQIPNLIQGIANLINNSIPQYLDQIVQHVWAIRSSLVWLIPPSIQQVGTDLIKDIDLESKLKELAETTQLLSESVAESISSTAQIESYHKRATEILEQIHTFERDVANAKANAEAHAISVATINNSISSELSKLTTNTEKQQILQIEIEKLKESALETLANASKIALSDSFSKRKIELSTQRRNWGIAFGIGIAALFLTSIFLIKGAFDIPPLVSKGEIDLAALLSRTAVIGPMVWFTWFSARQYGHLLRLIEDYAFKEASALAFIGYRDEMGEDIEMIKYLQESAIKNFASQPTRIFDGNDHSSPMHELIDKAMEKGSLDKVIELLKALPSLKK